MAKNIIIKPSPTNEPVIDFSGNSGGNISLKVMNDGTVAFVGNSGTLFTINDSLIGKLQGVYNISGLPIFEVYSDPSVIVYGPLQVNTSTYTNGLYLNPSNNNLNTGFSLYYDPSTKKVTYGLNGYVTFLSTGCVTVPEITYTTASIKVGTCKARLYPTNNYSGILKEYDIPEATFNFNQHTEYCISVFYNNGSPIYKLYTNLDEITESDITPVITFYHDGLSLHSVKWYDLGLGKVDKMHQRLIRTARFKREGLGMRISVDNYQHIKITNGVVWCGVNRILIPAFDSSINKMHYYSKTGGVWGFAMTNILNNNKYNNGANLVNVDSDKFAVNWIYTCAENDNDVYILPGEGNYTLNDAISSQEPIDIPLHVKYHAVLTGKVIYLCNATGPTQVQSISDVALTSGGAIADHNTLNNLQGGTNNQFYHLTQSEYSRVQLLDASFNSKAPINNPIFTGTVTVPSNISYNMYGSSRTPFLIYGGNATGQGLAIGGQGTTIIGGGASPNTVAANITSNESSTYISGDTVVKVISNLTSGWTNRKEFTFANDGVLYVPGLKVNNQSVLSGSIGTNGQVLYNDNGIISAGFKYNKTTDEISCNGLTLDGNNFNVIIGSNAVKSIPASNYAGLTVIGCYAGQNLTKFEKSTIIGTMAALSTTTAASSVVIGYGAGKNEQNLDNKFIIETNPTYNNPDNYLLLGNFNTREFTINGPIYQRRVIKNSVDSSISGQVTSVDMNPMRIFDKTKNWTDNSLSNKLVYITGGRGAGACSIIESNTSTGLVTLKFTVMDVDTTSTYKILDTTDLAQINMNSTVLVDLTNGDYALRMPNLGKGDINIIITKNPNRHTLYIVGYHTNNTHFLPYNMMRNSMVATFSEPGIMHNFREININSTFQGYVETNNKLNSVLKHITNTTNTINIDLYNEIYKLDVASNTTISFNMQQLTREILYNNCLTIELHINMTTVSTITWPASITWIDSVPVFNEIKKYVVVLRTMDAGASWQGNLAYKY